MESQEIAQPCPDFQDVYDDIVEEFYRYTHALLQIPRWHIPTHFASDYAKSYLKEQPGALFICEWCGGMQEAKYDRGMWEDGSSFAEQRQGQRFCCNACAAKHKRTLVLQSAMDKIALRQRAAQDHLACVDVAEECSVRVCGYHVERFRRSIENYLMLLARNAACLYAPIDDRGRIFDEGRHGTSYFALMGWPTRDSSPRMQQRALEQGRSA